VHGFPELAYSWRHQLPVLAAAGYRAIAPDMRGYGRSDKPLPVTDYAIQKLIGDIEGLMEALSIERAVIVGHDWGAMITWQMALLAPQRMAGLICLNIPHIPRPPINPITYMRWKLGKDFYIVNFQKSDEADRRFAEDPRRFINVMMRRKQFTRERPKSGRRKRRTLSLLQGARRLCGCVCRRRLYRTDQLVPKLGAKLEKHQGCRSGGPRSGAVCGRR
jgi:pimeloyl-ACP methyl ester carboxylesterase